MKLLIVKYKKLNMKILKKILKKFLIKLKKFLQINF